jgi:hypothetical protein
MKLALLRGGYLPIQKEEREREVDSAGRPVVVVSDWRLDDEVNLGGGTSGTEVVVWLAGAVSPGILGNAAYVSLERAVAAARRRRRADPRRPWAWFRPARPAVPEELARTIALLLVSVYASRVQRKRVAPEDLEVVQVAYEGRLWHVEVRGPRRRVGTLWSRVFDRDPLAGRADDDSDREAFTAHVPGDPRRVEDMRVVVRGER